MKTQAGKQLRAHIDRNCLVKITLVAALRTDMRWHQHSTEMGVSALTLYRTRWDVAVSDSKAKLTQAHSKAKLTQAYSMAKLSRAHLNQKQKLRQAHSKAKLSQAYPVKQYFKRTWTRTRTSEIWSMIHKAKTWSSNASLASAAQRSLTTTNPSPRIIQHFSRVWQGYPQSQLACSIPHLFVQRFWLGGGCRSGLSSINRSWWSWSCVWANLQSLPQDLDIYRRIPAYLRLQSTSASTIQAFDGGFKLPRVRCF